MRIALVAGEASGDLLGAALITALRRRLPDARFEGVAGPEMIAAGCRQIARIDELSVMGLAEVAPRLLEVLRLRRRLLRRWRADRPAVVVGIDAPDFNLGLERRLRRAGCRTVHVVSPSVWAWRSGRVRTVARAADLLLCLLPFEPQYYRGVKVEAVYIGHPLADALAAPMSMASARTALDLPAGRVVAVLPGSRLSEVKALAPVFARAAALLADRGPALTLAVPAARPALRTLFMEEVRRSAPSVRWRLYDGRAREVMSAADAVLLASGTAALECMLLGRPMVVGYRVSRVTAWLLRSLHLLRVDRFSLPNLLCGGSVVPEFIQERATPENFARALQELLDDEAARRRQTEAFARAGARLRCGAADRAAEAILRLVAAAS
ncbi:MAG TPA: lipid-A-disaccharide synthase [Nevskiaceae bacterium]